MAKLQNIERRPTKKVDLPSSTKDDPVWVEIYTEALSGDFEDVANVGEKKGSAIIQGIVNIIKDWNFFKEDGVTKEDINIDNVRRLTQEDLLFLIGQVEAYDSLNVLSDAQKKSLATTSLQKQSENTQKTPEA